MRIKAALSVAEHYSDNIYLTYQGEQDDFITRLNPELELEIALTKRKRIDIFYQGLFDKYGKADNFRLDHHFGGINFEIGSSKESLFQLGIRSENGANQPYSKNDESKDFWLNEIYSDLDWKITPITSLEAGYKHTIRSFDEKRYQKDDYIKDNVRLNILFSKRPNLPLLLEYRFEKQVNNNAQPESTELIDHAVMAGCRWRPERRLSGTLKLGYLWSQFNQMDAFDGWMIDTDLLYRISAFTYITISAERGLRASSYTARDTLDYYVFGGFGLILTYKRFDPLKLSVEGSYENRDFRSITLETASREDDLYDLSIFSDYQLKKWLALSFGYSYRTNQSSVIFQEYHENLFQFKVKFSI